MKLFTHKTFDILQMVDNKEDYQIIEQLYYFYISVSFNYWTADGFNGDIPFNTLNSAQEKLKELEQLEEIEQPLREGTVILALIFLAVVGVGIYKHLA